MISHETSRSIMKPYDQSLSQRGVFSAVTFLLVVMTTGIKGYTLPKRLLKLKAARPHLHNLRLFAYTPDHRHRQIPSQCARHFYVKIDITFCGSTGAGILDNQGWTSGSVHG